MMKVMHSNARASASPADAALAIYRQHDMADPLGRMRAMQRVASLYDAHSRELGAKSRLLESAAVRAMSAADEAGRQAMHYSDEAFEQCERADALDAALRAERATTALLREQLARVEAQLATERHETAQREAEHSAETERLAGLLEERRPLEVRIRELDDLVGELNETLVQTERKLRAVRADKVLLARAVLRGRELELGPSGGFDVQTIVHVTPAGVLATHLRPMSGVTSRERDDC